MANSSNQMSIIDLRDFMCSLFFLCFTFYLKTKSLQFQSMNIGKSIKGAKNSNRVLGSLNSKVLLDQFCCLSFSIGLTDKSEEFRLLESSQQLTTLLNSSLISFMLMQFSVSIFKTTWWEALTTFENFLTRSKQGLAKHYSTVGLIYGLNYNI